MTTRTPSSEELAATLARVAAIANDGGLDGMGEGSALAAIRLLTRGLWDSSGTEADRRRRVSWALDEAQKTQSPARLFRKANPPFQYP